jgi:gliding motility-associated lipoprotein GldB
MRTIIVFVCFVALLSSCNSDNCRPIPDTEGIVVDVSIERLEKELFALESVPAIVEFLDTQPSFARLFLQSDQYPNDTILARNIFKIIKDPYIDTLYRETMQEFGDISQLKAEFEQAFKNVKSYYPQFKEPKIQTVITGFANDMYVSDSLIIIGLDYFIGPEATFRPNDLPNYILERYQKEFIVPSILLILSEKFNKTDVRDKTLLAEMIYYGKAYYFTSRVLPCTNDSLLIGYSGEEIEEVNENEDIIWASLLHNKVIYETDHEMKKKFIGERPKVHEIGEKCPGRIGTWIGWEIVESYMKTHDDTSLQQIMSNGDAKAIFQQSKYNPM